MSLGTYISMGHRSGDYALKSLWVKGQKLGDWVPVVQVRNCRHGHLDPCESEVKGMMTRSLWALGPWVSDHLSEPGFLHG